MTRAAADVQHWVREFVIGLQLCPFAALPVGRGWVSYPVCPHGESEAAFAWTVGLLQDFVSTARPNAETWLLCFPDCLGDFGEFLDFVATLEELTQESGADHLVQFAHFHPRYCFAGVAADDSANKTNRSPHPVVQFLLVEGVAEAVAHYPDAAAIPDRNVALLRRL